MTEFNTICRRPHWPREPAIRSLLKALDIALPPKREQDSGEESDGNEEEAPESEAETVDEEVEGSSSFFSVIYVTFQVKMLMELLLRTGLA